MRLLRISCGLVPALLLLLGSRAEAVQFHLLDFEGFSDLTVLSNQYSAQYASFSNSTILKAGASLNEIDFPPFSGENVVLDAGGAMRIDFGLTTYDWSGHFTYDDALTVRAWDEFNNELGIVNSAFSQNYTSSGNAPNELLSFASLSGFRSITIEGAPAGGSFVMDDMSYTTADASQPVPEPGTIVLLAAGLASSGFAVRRRSLRTK